MKYGFAEFVASLTNDFNPVIGSGYTHEDYIAIDLSAKNPQLLKLEQLSSEAFSVYIDHNLKIANKKIAYGGYAEVRNLYQRSQLFNENQEQYLNRNIHIGLDIWAPAQTEILAALDGKVHSFQDNTNFGDYGPTIILEHSFQQKTFYTLYGHLNRASLESLEVGGSVKAQQKIAELGAPFENGDYAPHLHFQLINDIANKKGDYPGVASEKDLSFYKQNCPDPNLLLKI
ncbi:peptidoglycan DD-metalloendopeptidase family protein [Zunongwangia sp.]|uniref:peptidoglycan DD-metalloendopeptidase family protein n=1 Tax=Zunongwangia sp. TaxID=1965325 RepID=UPI003AA82B41